MSSREITVTMTMGAPAGVLAPVDCGEGTRKRRPWMIMLLAGALLAILLAAPAAAPATLGPGPEIQVNQTMAGIQHQPAVASDPGGGFTVVWGGTGTGDDMGIYARRFDATGAPLGGEIAVNTTTEDDQVTPAIAPDGSGGFTVVWGGTGTGDDRGIYARRFDATGAPLGGEIAVNATTEGNQSNPVIAAGPGGFTIAWMSDGQDGSGTGVFARRFDATGAPLGGEIAVSATTEDNQSRPAISPDPGGGFTIAWQSRSVDVDGWGFDQFDLNARRFDATGAPLGGEIAIDSVVPGLVGLPPSPPAIATSPSGGFTVAWGRTSVSGGCSLFDPYCNYPDWTLTTAVFARRFGAAGAPLGGEITISNVSEPSTPVIAPGPDGGFTVAWSGVYARRFDAMGAPLAFEAFTPTGKIPVSAPEEGNQPAIAPGDADGFTAVWVSSADGDTDIHARHLAEVDAPDTRIESGPGFTNDPTPTFGFSSSEEGSTFECRADSDLFAPCSGSSGSHTVPTELADGRHTFEVRAVDGTSVDPWPAGRSFTVDTIPPETYASFYYSPFFPTEAWTAIRLASTEAVTFECSLYAEGETPPEFSSCGYFESGWFIESGYYYYPPSVSDGDYVLEVRAIDRASNTDSTPAVLSFTVDTTPPEVEIDSGPGEPTTETTADFVFSSPDEDVYRFSCQLSGPGDSLWTDTPCNSPRTYTGLGDGAYSFEVRAEDTTGNLGPTATRSFTVDTEADTQIDVGPSGLTNDPTPTFSFSSEEGASFECRLDDGAYSACSSPHTTNPLADGAHSFEVRATDALGNTDPSAASRSFTVDTEAPAEPGFTATVPASPANDNTPLIKGSAGEGTVRIYAGADCSGPVAGEGGAAGFADPGIEVSVPDDSTTEFHATATDAAGNSSGCSADSISYIEDSTAPETTIESGPSGPTNDPTPTFEFTADEPGSTFECRLDDGAYSACGSPHTTNPLADGAHSFEVRATDALGNTDPSAASRSFTVDTAPPSTLFPDTAGHKPAASSVDTAPPRATLFGKSAQRAGKPIEVEVSCAEDCVVAAIGKVLVWAGARGSAPAHSSRRQARLGLMKVTKRLIAGQSATLKLRLKRKQRRGLVQLVRRGRKARAVIAVRYSDRIGNSRSRRHVIRLQRGGSAGGSRRSKSESRHNEGEEDASHDE